MSEPNLLPEDDDLLSYFLSTEINTQSDVGPDSSVVGMRSNQLPPFNSPRFSSFSQNGMNSNGDSNLSMFNSNVSNPNRKQMNIRIPSSGALSNSIGNERVSDSTTTSTTNHSGSTANSTSSQNAEGTLDDDERRQRRLARNRESARQSRRRKKQYLELLEEKVSQLTEEISNFRRMHLESCGPKLQELKLELLNSLEQQINSSPKDGDVTLFEQEIDRGRKMLQQRFGPNCEERQIVTEYHFQQLFSLLLPPYTKFLIWLSVQKEEFFTAAAVGTKGNSPNTSDGQPLSHTRTTEGLWPLLCNELGLTFEQEEKLKCQYRSLETKASRTARRRLAIAMEYLERLRTTISQRATTVQSHSDQIHSILTPSQSIKYLAWLENNREKLRESGVGKGFACASFSSLSGDGNDKINAILKKSDQDLTVEDITEMLSALSQPSSNPSTNTSNLNSKNDDSPKSATME